MADFICSIADEVFARMNEPREILPFSDAFPELDLAGAYAVVADIRRRREARGERVVGRKIGFTNAAAWTGYGITGPIWNYLYDTTTLDLPLAGADHPVRRWPNLRMEAEVALGLKEAPEPGMSDSGLMACVEWAALDFEICTSIFPDWRFKVADAATTGVHVALLIGPRHVIGDEGDRWERAFREFVATLSSGRTSATGGGRDVLGSPIKALGYLVKELKRFGGEPLRAGEIVTTGTLTRALPATAGEAWRAEVSGIDFAPIEVRLS
jgi:2-oxo-3-hexenedioate decarboxylase